MIKIRHEAPRRVAEQLTRAFITSRLDNSNSLLFGLPDVLIKNAANDPESSCAHGDLDEKIGPYLASPSTGALSSNQETHCLQDPSLYIQTYKALNGLAPGYIADILQVRSQVCSLRSAGEYTCCLCLGPASIARAFSVAEPRLWRPLPIHIKISNSASRF